MKYLSNILAVMATGLLLFVATSCADFGDLNVNPTQSTDMDPGFQMSYCQVWMSQNRYEAWRTNFILTSCMIQHTAHTGSYFEGDKYTYNIPSYNAALWESAYTREIKNIIDLINRIEGDPLYTNTYHAARILKVYIFSRLTDLHGDIPYSEAGLGFLEREFFPAYDTQESIYLDFLSELESSVAGLNASEASVRGDIFFNGDVAKWKKWGNSLRLRLGFRLAKVNPSLAQETVAAAIAGGVMESNADMVVMQHDAIRTNGNSDVFYADKGMRLAKTFVDHMIETGDPRLPIYGAIFMDQTTLDNYPIPNATSTPINNEVGSFNMVVDATTGQNILFNAYADRTGIDGMPNGTEAADLGDGEINRFVQPNYANIAPRATPYIHQSYAEVEFLLAEAAVRGWGGATDAAGHFANALRAMVEMMAIYPGESASIVESADIDAYVAANPLTGGTEEQLEQIGTFLWSALYLDGYEAFASWRRTGYPNLVPVDHPSGITGGTIPRRIHYPIAEAANNAENYAAAVARMTDGDSYTSRVWWDAQ
ncbi:MAG: SusD/RagB family nutrient-binding outer membrane lipoprotein [Bacteroidetes bacterium]|nr:MAG: SusD/RagB family nutrient-binding outer membrane lipoprotein [Bacteroidota bacterium]